MNSQIVFGTTSKPRLELLKKSNIPHISTASSVDEQNFSRPTSPTCLVETLAQFKAEEIAYNILKSSEKIKVDDVIIGLDSVAYFNGKILEKPNCVEDAIARLKMLSGNSHDVYTGIFYLQLKDNNSFLTYNDIVKSIVHLDTISDIDVIKHVNRNPSVLENALGYNPHDTNFIKRIDGSQNNFLYGMPINVIINTLQNRFGFDFNINR